MLLTPTPIIQFGTSKFLQAHADLLFHEAGLERAITVVASSGGAAGENRLEGLNDRRGFPVHIRGLERGEVIKTDVRVKSVAQALSTARDWATIRKLVVEDADYILSNTTESGFDVPQDFSLNFSDKSETAPPNYPAKVLALLHARYEAGRPGLTILPTELVSSNGDRLKAVVQRLARRSGASDSFAAWIECDCIFVNSLVDRIVSEALHPVGAIAEPYSLWAIENQPGLKMPCVHSAIKITDDLEQIQRLKLHILNLGHTLLGEMHIQERRDERESVFDMLSDPPIRKWLETVYETEVLPGFCARGFGDDAAAYAETTMDRYLNPYLDHKMAFIIKNHSSKVASRIGDFFKWIDGNSNLSSEAELLKIATKYGCA